MPQDESSGLFQVGDVIIRRNAKRTPGKIVGIRVDPAEPLRVTYGVVTVNRRFAEWAGHVHWTFIDPFDMADQLDRQAAWYTSKANLIRGKAESAKNVT